ncbi:uncharacterized protein [Palaemon carinicauda]|uniref:uncharacterized protein n=1 Tax=Palaemon carinicauda TaxID=392227 RepID=UPI0035B66954
MEMWPVFIIPCEYILTIYDFPMSPNEESIRHALWGLSDKRDSEWVSPFNNTTTATTVDNNPVLIPQSSIPSAATVIPQAQAQAQAQEAPGMCSKKRTKGMITHSQNDDEDDDDDNFTMHTRGEMVTNMPLKNKPSDDTLREVFDKVQNVPISNSKYPQMVQAIGHINRNMKAMLHKRGGEATYNDFSNDTEKKENEKEFNDHASQKNSFSDDNIPITKEFDHGKVFVDDDNDNANFIIKDNYTTRETRFFEDNTTTINNKEDEDDEIKEDSDDDEVFVDDDSDNAKFIIKDNYTSRETHFF